MGPNLEHMPIPARCPMANRPKRRDGRRKPTGSRTIRQRSKDKSARLRYQDLTARQREIRKKALRAVSRSRRKGVSLKAAAREEHVSMRSIARYVPAATKQDKSGQLVATKGDRYRREMLLPSALGEIPISVYSSREATRLTKYRLALADYARTGIELVLRPFQSLTVSGHALPTDPGQIMTLLGAGEFQPDRLYAAIGGAA
jgi:hypothetical protein